MARTLDEQIAAKDLSYDRYAYIEANKKDPVKYPLPYPQFIADIEAQVNTAPTS